MREVDGWVKAGRFANRSRAMQVVRGEKVTLRGRHRGNEGLAKLNRKKQRALAEESFINESPCP